MDPLVKAALTQTLDDSAHALGTISNTINVVHVGLGKVDIGPDHPFNGYSELLSAAEDFLGNIIEAMNLMTTFINFLPQQQQQQIQDSDDSGMEEENE